MLRFFTQRWRDERGVAMATVLLAGSALTVVASTAAFMTVQEFRSSGDDRRAVEALSYAEAGIDRFVYELRRGQSIDYGDLRRAGCEGAPVNITGSIAGDSDRTYRGQLVVYDNAPGVSPPANRFPPTSCASRPDSPRDPLFLAVTSTGEHPTARRVVRQILEVEAIELPIGIYAESVNTVGNGAMQTVSLLTPGDMFGREKIGFTGVDPYYTVDDFYQNGDDRQIPAAPHAAGTIYFTQSGPGGLNIAEHPPSPNCDANRRGDRGASVWDGDNPGGPLTSGCPPLYTTFYPPTAHFSSEDLQRIAPEPNLPEEDYLTLRESAQDAGIYCAGPDMRCTINGVAATRSDRVIQESDVVGLPKSFVAYFEFPPGSDPTATANTIKWKPDVLPCSDDPAVNRSVILIVRHGSLSVQNGAEITGSVFVPEGRLDSEGTYTIHGSVIANELIIRGGSNYQLSPCWINNMPGPLTDVRLHRWSEVDR